MSNLKHSILSVICFVTMFFVASCSIININTENINTEQGCSLSISNPNPAGGKGTQNLKVQAVGEWTLSLVFGEDEEPWASLDTKSGTGSKSNIFITYEPNYSEISRTVTIVLENGANSASCILTQKPSATGGGGSQGTPEKIVGEPVPLWLELPAISDKSLYFLTHEQTIVSTTIRSWSYLWDTDALVAHWVAYPLNKWTIGSGSRTDAWGLDPKVPKDLQPVLYKAFRGGYDRGHQLPSADMLYPEANMTTFYGTNMTPQLGSLNQNGWASLEGKVRDWAGKFDTLYVCTGCTVKGSTKVAYDNEGKAVKVPTAYFKALLGYKKNGTISITASTGGYTGIAFYYPHEAYSGSWQSKAMSIDELEAKVGEDFFVNLPSKIGADRAAQVESYFSSSDNLWK